MSFSITKIDRRMNGYGQFSHRLDFNGAYFDAIDRLQDVREWLWENYGPGSEVRTAQKRKLSWGWDTTDNYRRIYVTEQILSILKLKWC